MADNDERTEINSILSEARANLLSIKAGMETAKTTANELMEMKRIAAGVAADVQAKFEEIIKTATQAVAAKTKITDDQTVIATKSEHIQKAQEHADKVRADLDRELTAAKTQVTEAEALRASVKTAFDSTASLIASIQTAKISAEKDSNIIDKAKAASEQSAVQTKALADKASEVEIKVKTYEDRLQELDKLCVNQLKTIENLLPGATAAGLATSFDLRRKSFLKPHTHWQWVFVTSVILIVLLAVTGLYHVLESGTPPTYDELFRLWLSRLPVAGALIWLAVTASHESALAKRLEEDYGYKAAVSSCLMGFQKQISEIGKDAMTNPSLVKLLDNTLATISAPPGRIYDKHKLTVSPTGELTNAVKAVGEVAGMKNQRPEA